MRKKTMLFDKKRGGDDIINSTVIASGVFIEGSFKTGDKQAFINGDIAGSCESVGELIIGPDATINGDITGKVIIVQGKVIGDIYARSKLELLTTAVVKGNITTKSLVVDEDAVFNGTCIMTGNSESIPDEQEDSIKDLEFIDMGNDSIEMGGK